MAQVLAPIVQTTTSITMLHSSSDAFQTPPVQPHHTQQRSSQMPRNQPSYAQAAGAGYRGTSAPIAPYAFSSTPQLRQENRSTSGPHQQPLQHQAPSATTARLGHPSHPSSSSDSTVSTSSSSNRSLAASSSTAKDGDDLRKSFVDSLPKLSTSEPDLSLSIPDAPVKPSPGRYRRAAGRTDSSNSANASSASLTPTQQSPSIGASSTSSTIKSQDIADTVDLPLPIRPGHTRASSVDDMHVPRGTLEQAKRYRRRSLSGLEATALTTSPAPLAPNVPTPATASKRPAQETRPMSSSSRHDARSDSSKSHERQGSSGSASSHASNRPSVSSYCLHLVLC